MQAIHAQTLIQAFEAWSPKYLAIEDDPIGLLVGTLNKRVKKVMVTLDVLENVVDEAIRENVDLIIAHHPLIFKPLSKVYSDQGQGKIVSKCIQHDIAVYAAHTNLDIAHGGVNDLLAEALKLKDVEILKPTYHEKLYKFVVYVPHTNVEELRQTLGAAGAGFIGKYSHCTFNTKGVGTFIPEAGSKPYIGKQHQLEKVEEVKIETIVQEGLLKNVISRVKKAHPYEEVAYDVFPLENKGRAFGLGRIGKLKEPMNLKDFAAYVKVTYGIDGLRYVGDPEAMITKVAVLGGDGNKYLAQASRKGADVLVTGDIYYHTAHDAMLMNLNLIDAGHHIESIMKNHVANFLLNVIQENKTNTDVIVSEANTNPFTFMV